MTIRKKKVSKYYYVPYRPKKRREWEKEENERNGKMEGGRLLARRGERKTKSKTLFAMRKENNIWMRGYISLRVMTHDTQLEPREWEWATARRKSERKKGKYVEDDEQECKRKKEKSTTTVCCVCCKLRRRSETSSDDLGTAKTEAAIKFGRLRSYIVTIAVTR